MLVDLKREMATKILEDAPPGYVLFHFDGDRPWGERERSETTRAFESFREQLRPLIEHNLRERDLVSEADDIELSVTDRLHRICPLTPHYSIEAWLYQNTGRARELCEQGCGRHIEVIAEWERDRARLDELVKPKLNCRKLHNDELAQSFTSALADELYKLGKSFHHTVERLRTCPGLVDALRTTWEPAQPSA